MPTEKAQPDPQHDESERMRIEAAQLDSSRFAELYEENFDRIYAYIVRRVRDRADAQDLTAEGFHHALRNLGRYEYRGLPFAAWLFRIAATAIADHARRAAGEIPVLDLDPAGSGALDEIESKARLFRL